MEYLPVFIVCLAGSIIQGITGFGFAMVVMSFLPFFLPMRTAAVISLLMTVYTGVMVSMMLRKSMNLRVAVFPVVASLLSIPLGVYLLLSFPEKLLRILLGVLIMALSIFFFINSKRNIKIKPHPMNGIVAGLVSGMTTGMFNIGGPPLVLYYLHATADKLVYRACLEFSFAVGAIFAFTNHIVHGNVDMQMFSYSLVGAAAVTIGNLMGLTLFKKLNPGVITKSVYAVMFVLSITIILKN